MIRYGLFRAAGGVLLAGLLVSAAVAGPRMEVEVAADGLSERALHVTMRLEGFGDGPLRLRGVPTWVDNPIAEPRGEVVRQLRVRDADGNEIRAQFSRDERGEGGWTLESAGELAIDYRLDVDFRAGEMAGSYAILVPFMDDERAWLLGNHVFLTPDFGGDRVDELLRELPIDLTFEVPHSMDFVGPPRTTQVHNLFELLSLQFGFGDFHALEVPARGIDVRLVLFDRSGFSPAERERLQWAAEDLTARAMELFGGAPTGELDMLVFRKDGIGGLEGSFAFHAYLPGAVDLADRRDEKQAKFYTVLAHELVHSWLPIALFPKDDPWVKEGFTSWYGHVLAARGGWVGPAHVDRLFAGYGDAVFGDVPLEDVALSDPRLWFEEYSGESWRRVTYDRGHAVTMLLDVHIRGETNNRRSLDDVLAMLFDRHRHAGFDRAEFLIAIEDATGVDARGFFGTWVDSRKAPSVDVVDRALRRAVKYGAFAAD